MARTPADRNMHLPGNLTSPRAGPILCPGAPVSCQWDSDDATSIVRGFVIEDLGPERVIWCSPSRYIARDNRARVFLSLDLTADLGPTVALRWLGRHYGIDVGIGCPAWVYSAATRDSVASWSLIGVDGKRYVFCDYPPDIEATNGPPIDRETYANLRNLPTNSLEALVAACLHAAGV